MFNFEVVEKEKKKTKVEKLRKCHRLASEELDLPSGDHECQSQTFYGTPSDPANRMSLLSLQPH